MSKEQVSKEQVSKPDHYVHTLREAVQLEGTGISSEGVGGGVLNSFDDLLEKVGVKAVADQVTGLGLSHTHLLEDVALGVHSSEYVHKVVCRHEGEV